MLDITKETWKKNGVEVITVHRRRRRSNGSVL